MTLTPSGRGRSRIAAKHVASTVNSACNESSAPISPRGSTESRTATPLTSTSTIPCLEEYCSPAFSYGQLKFHDRTLGEGRNGKVVLADYRGLLVACKMRRPNQPRREFVKRLRRELSFAAELAICRSTNPYLGVIACKRSEFYPRPGSCRNPNDFEYFVVQRYYEQGDLLAYMNNRDKPLQLYEVIRIGLSIFFCLADAHRLDIGMVDVKRENVLIDHTGSAILTDFGSCVRMQGRKNISLLEDREDMVRWTKDVAAPEMIAHNEFWLASDVFMGTLILAELMTGHLTGDEFKVKVLRRHARNGTVSFQAAEIPTHFSAFYELLSRGLDSEPSNRILATTVIEMLKKIEESLFSIYPNDEFNSFWLEKTYEEAKHVYDDSDRSLGELILPAGKSDLNNGYTPKSTSLRSVDLSNSDEEELNKEETILRPAIRKKHIEKTPSSRQLRDRKGFTESTTALVKRQRLLRENNRPFFFGQRR